MEQFRNTLLSDIECLQGASKAQVDSFVRVFFNRRSTGNRTLVLGAGDASMVKEILTVPASDLINDDKPYLVRIRKVKSGKDRIIFSFNQAGSDIPFGKREKIRDLFRFYQCEDRSDLDSALANGTIPPLCIPMTVMNFMVRRHDYLSVLSGEGLVKEVTIETSLTGSTMVAGSSEVIIIPASNELLIQESAAYSKTDKHENSFWEDFSEKTYINHSDFNFVILNSVNDHIFRVFHELFVNYRQRFGLTPEHEHILSRVFFIKDGTLLVNSRVMENLSEDDKVLFSCLHDNPESLLDARSDMQLYSCMLDILTSDSCVKESQLMDLSYGKFHKTKSAMSAAIKILAESVSGFTPMYNRLCSEVNNINCLIQNEIMERSLIFTKIDSTIMDMVSFCERYSKGALAQVFEVKSDADSQKDKCLKKAKGLFRFGFEIKEKMYLGCVESIVSKIVCLWNQAIPACLEIDAWIDVDHATSDCGSVCNEVSGEVQTLPEFTRSLIGFGKEICGYEASVSGIRETLDVLHSECDLTSLASGKLSHSINGLVEKWQESETAQNLKLITKTGSSKEYTDRGIDVIKKKLSAKLNEMLCIFEENRNY